ncbi:hypothetical protein ILUMI_17868, partial [Ignelater luminosus]
YDPETMSFRFTIEFGSVTMLLFVNVNGHVIRIPVEGNGISRHAYDKLIFLSTFVHCITLILFLESISAIIEIKGDMRRFKEIYYYNPKKVNVTLDMRDANFYVKGLFDNNELLVRMTNEMLNANSTLVSKVITPMFEKLAEIGVMRFMKNLTKIPYSKLFPPSK